MVNGLVVRKVSFSYRAGHSVLEDVYLHVPVGCFTAVVGPNGAGKSTLLRCVVGILRPDSGEVRLDGLRVADMRRREVARRIAYVPQRIGRLFPMTAFDTVLMGRRPHVAWRPSRHDLDVVWRVMEELEITEFADRYVTDLSGGEAQKVFIARALTQQAEFLLLDEPTGNLDVLHQLEIMEHLRRLAHRDNLAVFMALHDLNLAARYSEQTVMLKGGRVVAVGPPEEVLVPRNLEAAYGVKAVIKGDEDGRHIFVKLPDSKQSHQASRAN